MGTQEFDRARAAYQTTLAARREAVEKLAQVNNAHNRAEFLQIVEVLEALKDVVRDENTRD